SQDCKGLLIINTDREESVIYINNEYAGKGNLKIELDAGFYNVVAKENSNSRGNRSLSGSVDIKKCNHQTLVFNFDEEIYLETVPQDAAVFMNDSLLGYTPLYLAGSIGSLELKKPGFKNKLVSLKNYSKPFTLDFIGKTKELNFYERDLFKYLLAGIVVLGGTTAYFKLKADEKFEEYEITGDQVLLDETERFDLISGITFTALQINFGVLIYFFLND
ncbi:MAG: PEGA domain-containing protein, partial [Ignavibacteriales bacterium]